MNGRIPGFQAHLNTQLTSTPMIVFRPTANGAVETFRMPFKPIAGIRVTTRIMAMIPYGTQAITGEMFASTFMDSSSCTAVVAFQWSSHADFSGNSNLLLGTRIPFLAVKIVTARPKIPPIRDGNSGPRNAAQIR